MREADGLPTVHATAVLLGSAGLLIRGPSGAGKTTAALALIDHYAAQSRFAALVADDRVILQERAGRIVARAPASIAGLVEARGIGILHVPYEAAAVLRLVVDLAPQGSAPRIPDGTERVVELLGVILPRLVVSPGPSLVPLVSLALQTISQSRDMARRACVCAAT